jgi:hypothetical protein
MRVVCRYGSISEDIQFVAIGVGENKTAFPVVGPVFSRSPLLLGSSFGSAGSVFT